jgi:hypothetical protein
LLEPIFKTNKELLSFGLIALLLNILLFLGVSKEGLGLSIDSINYLSAAKSLAAGKGLILFDGNSLINAVPLYSFLLAPAYLFGINPLHFAQLLQFFFFNLNGLFVYLILRKLLINQNWILVFWLLAVGHYFAYVQVYVWALSEMGFMALLSAYIYLLLYQPQNKLASATLLALLCLQRYIIWLMLPGLLFYWFKQKRKLPELLWQLLPALLTTALWLYRNYSLLGSATGDHSLWQKFGLIPLFTNLQNVAAGIFALNPLYAGIVFYLFSLAVLAVNLKRLPGKAKDFCALLFYMGLSLVLLLLGQANLQMSQLPRYLSVFYVLVFLGPLLYLDQLKWQNGFKKFVLVLLLGLSFFMLIKKGLEWRQTGLGTLTTLAYWVEIENVALSKYSDLPMLSNFPDVVWLKTGKTCGYTKYSAEDYDAFAKRNVAGLYKVIWFKDSSREMLIDEGLLYNNADFTPMYDGHWYKIGMLKIGSAY